MQYFLSFDVPEAHSSSRAYYTQLEVSDIPLVALAYLLLHDLCRVSAETMIPLSLEVPRETPELSQDQKDASHSIAPSHLCSSFNSHLSLELLSSSLSTSPTLFSLHPVFDEVLEFTVEPLLLKLLAAPTLKFTDSLR